MMQQKYLPFTEQQLLSHFAKIRRNGECTRNAKHLEYYKDGIKRYNEYLANDRDRLGRPLKETRKRCQIEKDERFWIAACMMSIFYSRNRTEQYVSLFKAAYGNEPVVEGTNSWHDCFKGKLYLFSLSHLFINLLC